jgi:hypothetical protein
MTFHRKDSWGALRGVGDWCIEEKIGKDWTRVELCVMTAEGERSVIVPTEVIDILRDKVPFVKSEGWQ